MQCSSLSSLHVAYNAFVRYGRQSPKWCASHKLNYKALLRAVSIRKQLGKYLERFNIPVESCEGDAKRLRKCLVTGYFKVSLVDVILGARSHNGVNVENRMPPACCLTELIEVCGRTQ